jgi:hypothetical protein
VPISIWFWKWRLHLVSTIRFARSLTLQHEKCLHTAARPAAQQRQPAMSKTFQKGWGDWKRYRRPDCQEVDLHFGERDRQAKSYREAMAEVTELVERTLREAQQDGRPYVMFRHGRSTSRRGKVTARSQVRGFMRSPKATPLIQRGHCIQHKTIFLAKVRLNSSSKSDCAVTTT